MTKLFLKKPDLFLVMTVFLAAIIVRFLYFPDNVYFAFDQARDSFASLEILKGDFKIVGPPSFLNDKLFPGPAVYYLYAPIYLFFDKSPEAASAFFRIWNSVGIFLVFLIGSILFNKRTGIIAAIFFAFSYEQSQYSLFLSHQPLAVISVLLFYLGLSLYLFAKKPWGLLLNAAGLGLSIQFHYGYIFLAAVSSLCLIIFRKNIKSLHLKWLLLSSLLFILTISTFILTEFKYHFLSDLITQSQTAKIQFFSGLHLQETFFIINRFLHDSFLANYKLTPLLGIVFILITLHLLFQKQLREKVIFLIIWFIFGLSLYLFSGVSSYYYSAATSISLLLLSSYFLDKLFSSSKMLLSLIIIVAIIVNNLILIFTINPNGLNSDMAIQPGMLTSSQKKILDYIYLQSGNKPFAVSALSIPLKINTTWSYLFEWYGQKKYGYLPVWIGPTASGYAGNLSVINARLKLPEKQFLIIEPTTGIREIDKENFFREEGYFTKKIEEKTFGTITVQLRQPY